MRHPLFLLCCLALGGCTWEPGQGFAVVEPTVRAAYESLPSRDVGNDYQRLSSDYQVHVESAELELSGVELIASAGGAPGSFDPANPPPRYSNCHGGHCHRDDGALIPYEQIAEEMGGGGGSRTVVTLPVDQPMNLLAPEPREVGCTPDCALPRAEVSQGRWGLETLRIEGTVRDSRPTPRLPGERRFLLNLTSTGEAPVAVLSGPVDLPSDREHPPRAKLALNLVLTAALFDPLDWGALAVETDGVVDFADPANDEARKVLLERLAQLSPEAEVTRGDP
jgi:hypothetical protein